MFITIKGLISISCGTYGFMNINPFLKNQLWLQVNVDGLPTLILIHIYGLLFYVFFFIYFLYVLADEHVLSCANITNEIELQGELNGCVGSQQNWEGGD